MCTQCIYVAHRHMHMLKGFKYKATPGAGGQRWDSQEVGSGGWVTRPYNPPGLLSRNPPGCPTMVTAPTQQAGQNMAGPGSGQTHPATPNSQGRLGSFWLLFQELSGQ